MKLPWNNLEGPAKRALIIHALYWQIMAMGGGFVGVYVFRLSGNVYTQPLIYQLFFNAIIPFGFWAGAEISRRKGSAASMRSGLICYLVYFFSFFCLRERSVDFLPPLALLGGMATGFYWFGFMVMVSDLSGNHNRQNFLSSGLIGMFLSGLIGGPLAGWFLASYVGVQGYMYVFAFAIILAVIAWTISLKLKTPALDIRSNLVEILKGPKPAGWWRTLMSTGLMGLGSVSAMFFAQLLAFETKGSEIGTGQYAFFNAITGLSASWVVADMSLPGKRGKTLFWASLGIAALTLPLVFERTFALVLLYGAGMALMQSFYGVPMVAAHFGLIDVAPRLKAAREEVMIIREIFVNAGRVVGYVFLLFTVTTSASEMLNVFFGIMAFVPLGNYLLMRKYV